MSKIKDNKIQEIFSCNDIDEFVKSVRQILPYRGYSESKFFLCEMQGIEFLTKLSFYKKTTPEIYKKGSSDDETPDDSMVVNPNDAEIGILTILREEIIEKNISPCILELVHSKKCPSLKPIIPDGTLCDKFVTQPVVKPKIKDIVYEMFCRHLDLVNSGLAHKKFSWLVLEECDITFHEFIKRYVEDNPIDYHIFKSLMFQIIYTIYAITRVFPKFRHSDLHTENVMLKFDRKFEYNPTSLKFLQFRIGNITYNVPYFGIICKIIDFGFASIPSRNIISYASEDRQIMFMRTKNDLLFFFHDIYETAGKNNSIVDFLTSVEPNKTFIHYNTEYIRRNLEKVPRYIHMVTNDVFSDYTNLEISDEQIHHQYRCVPYSDLKLGIM